MLWSILLVASLVPAHALAEAIEELEEPLANQPAKAIEVVDEQDVMPLEAQADEVTYLDKRWDAALSRVVNEIKTVPDGYKVLEEGSSLEASYTDCWLVAQGDDVVLSGNECVFHGTVNLVLMDNCLIALDADAFQIAANSTLNIYAQSEGDLSGFLDLVGHQGLQLFNGAMMNVYGGNVTATAEDRTYPGIYIGINSGTVVAEINMYGGFLTSYGFSSDGIGVNRVYGKKGDTLNLTFYGGGLTAEGTRNSFGISPSSDDKNTGSAKLNIAPGCKVWDVAYDGSKTLICEGPQDNVAARAQTMYIESLPAVEELDVKLLQQKPYPVWDSAPESTDHYKVVATVTKADGTQSTCEEDYQPVNVAYGGSVDFSNFVAEQGDGSYVFEVLAYDESNELLAFGKSAPQDFCRVELQVALLDEGGNAIEDEQDPASVMLTINDSGASSESESVQCGPNGAAACLEARAADAGYLFKGFSIAYADGSQDQVEQNPYNFTLTKGMVVTATFQRDTAEIPVTLHVGEGHEEYAQQIVDALNVEFGEGFAQLAQNGVDIVYSTLKAQTKHDVMNDLQGVLWDLDAQYGMPAPGYVLGAAESYASEEDYLADVENDEMPLGDSLDLYLLWNKVVTQVDITVDAPVCGTQIAMEGWSQSPSPNASLTEGGHARIAHSYWKGEGNPPYFEGNIVGGTAYTANVSFMPEFGYSFGDALVVTANGAAVDVSMRGSGFEANIPVVAVHSWNGNECSGCSAQKRTVSFNANGGSGSMESVFVASGNEFTLPSCGFVAPAGKVFAGWQVGDATAAFREGATITVLDDVTVKAVWEDLPTTPTFKSCYLVLSGMIGVTFTMAMPQDFVVGNSRMDFEVCGKTTSVSMADLSPDSYGRYHFTCYINSVQMADAISAKFYYGENLSEPVETTYSVQRYIDYIGQNSPDYDDTTLNLIRSINDYGYYAQEYLSVQNHWKLGEGGSHAKMSSAYEKSYDYGAVKEEVEQYAVYKALGESGAKVSYKLHLDSATGISVRVAPGADDVSIQSVTGEFNGKTYQAEEQSDGSYIVRMDGISAHQLADDFRVTGATSKGSFQARVCALSYARTVFNGSSYSDAAKNAMAAFYKYYGAAESYKQAHPFQ